MVNKTMLENNQQRHEMLLEKSHPSGAEEWYCPSCGRRFVMQWPPKYKRIVLNDGDLNAVHSGSKGGLSIGATRIQQGEDSAPSNEDDLPLEQWKSWLDSIETSKWWPED